VTAGARAPRPGDDPGDDHVSITTLPSGLRVVTEAVPGARSVSMGVWVGVGSRDEPAELAGVSHFLEHLLFKGTAERDARAIAASIDRLGGDLNAFTAKESTAFYARVPAGHLAAAAEVLGDVLTRPALRDVDVDNERQVILEELAMDADDPEDRVHTLVEASLFPRHPLGRETAGQPDTVAALQAGDVRCFFRQWYRPANMVVAAAGAVSHDEVVEHVGRAFGTEVGGEQPRRHGPGARIRPMAAVRRRTEQANLALAFRGVARNDPRREALEVANHVLGGGLSSRLFDEIRERRGLAYAVYSTTATYADAGSLVVYAGTGPEHGAEVLGLVVAEVERLAADGITDEELEVAVGALAGSYVLGLEDAGSRMGRLGGSVLARGAVRPVAEQVARYRAVDREAVAAVSAAVLGGPRAVAGVGPVARRDLEVWAGGGWACSGGVRRAVPSRSSSASSTSASGGRSTGCS
jgi:predicted Zn-dependent peptidase